MSTTRVREKAYTIAVTTADILDVKIFTAKGKIQGFVLSYRARIDQEWHEAYRIDTCHGYLHEQKFWRSPDPIPLKQYAGYPTQAVYEASLDNIRQNWKRYKRYLEKKVSKKKEKKDGHNKRER